MATRSGVPASVVISQAAPTPWTMVPVALTRLASHKARKTRSRSGAKIPMPGAAIWLSRGMPPISAAPSPALRPPVFDRVHRIMRLPKNAARLESQDTGPVVHHGQQHRPRPAERRRRHPAGAALRAALMILGNRADDHLMLEQPERPLLRGRMSSGNRYSRRCSNPGSGIARDGRASSPRRRRGDCGAPPS
jgi:hypothetical protein